MSTSLSIAQTLASAQTAGLARLDAQLLLLHALRKAPHHRAWLLAHDSDLLPRRAALEFAELSTRRLAGEPLAYIVGYKEFFGLSLQVDARVLVPRPETETLVEWALQCLEAYSFPAASRVLDLGTGSGAIALALKINRPALALFAVDASKDALAVAQANAQSHRLAVQFAQSDWLQNVSGPFHLIVSNPPYVADGDSHLPALAHEPLRALTAGLDGLDDIRQIVHDAPAHLHPQGWLLLEHGHDQSDKVQALLAERGFAEVQSRRDLAGVARCSGGRWPGLPGTASQTAG